jgi:hypothetical protein
MNTVIFVGIAAMAAISFGAKPVGYLARIGAAPLRFQTPCAGPDMTVELPPLKMSEPAPALREVTTNEIAAVEAPVDTTAALVVSSPAATVEPAFTPQMLLQFFNQNSTNYETSVFVPYNFNPPVAPTIPAPPSRATYTKK